MQILHNIIGNEYSGINMVFTYNIIGFWQFKLVEYNIIVVA